MPTRDPILNYRNPTTPAGRVVRALPHLRTRVAAGNVRVITKLAGGIPLSFVGPAFLASLIVAIEVFAAPTGGLGWWPLFAICCAVMIPILYLVERRTGGNFLTDELRAQGAGDDISDLGIMRTSSYGEWEMRTNAASLAIFTELLLFAPRLVFSALAERREKAELAGVSLERAAEIVDALALHDTGVPVVTFARDGEPPRELGRALRLLIIYDFVGMSKDAQRVWLLTTARKAMGAG